MHSESHTVVVLELRNIKIEIQASCCNNALQCHMDAFENRCTISSSLIKFIQCQSCALLLLGNQIFSI